MAIFSAVVESGSFRAAARALKLSPSVVSHHVGALEKRLGTALLYRSTRKLSLTHDGARLLEASQAMIASARAGLDDIGRRTGEPAGRLSVAVTGAVFENPPYINHLAAFAARHKRIDLSISFSDRKVDIIGSAFDAAIRIGWLEDSRYKARKLAEIERTLVAAPAYAEGRPLPDGIEDLETWDWIKLAQLPVSRQLTGRSGDTPAITPHVAIEVDSVTALCRMAVAGLGVACVPRFLVEPELHDGRLIALTPDWDLMAPGVYVVWPGNVSQDSLVMTFVHFLAGQMNAAVTPTHHR